jgi:Flp pilus assembly pilin Flp
MIKNFAADESGAVTVDWVVLTAAIVGLGLAVMTVVSGGVETLSTDISDDLAAMDASSDIFANN